MTPPTGPPDFAKVVGAKHAKSTAYVAASSDDCLRIRDAEAKKVNRRLKAIAPGDLAAIRFPKSWMVAIVLCPGDDTGDVAAWAKSLSAGELERIRFYLHGRTDPAKAFSEWYRAGLGDPKTADMEDFNSFHKVFGWDFNNQVYGDALAGII